MIMVEKRVLVTVEQNGIAMGEKHGFIMFEQKKYPPLSQFDFVLL